MRGGLFGRGFAGGERERGFNNVFCSVFWGVGGVGVKGGNLEIGR